MPDELRSRRDLTISDLVSVILGRDLRPESLELTINAALQRGRIRGLWAGSQGAVVAIDPRTGAVLASVSSPSYDPESLLGGDAADGVGEPPGRSRRASPRPRHQGDLPARARRSRPW